MSILIDKINLNKKYAHADELIVKANTEGLTETEYLDLTTLAPGYKSFATNVIDGLDLYF